MRAKIRLTVCIKAIVVKALITVEEQGSVDVAVLVRQRIEHTEFDLVILIGIIGITRIAEYSVIYKTS